MIARYLDNPNGSAEGHRRDRERGGQRRRSDAAPGARHRGADRSVPRPGHRWAALLHFRSEAAGERLMSENTYQVDTVERATETPDVEQPFAALGVKDDEYARIREILGRRPTSLRAGHVLGDVVGALLLQVLEGAPQAVRRQGPGRRLPARRPGRERGRRGRRRGPGRHLQDRVAQPPVLRRALSGCGDRRRRHRARHPHHGRAADRRARPAALRPGGRGRHAPGAARRGARHRRLRQLRSACRTSAARSSSTPATPATRW